MPVVSSLQRKMVFFTCVTLLSFLATSKSDFIPCSPRSYGTGNIVCVCNETYCDSIGKISPPSLGVVDVFESNSAGSRFSKTSGNFMATGPSNNENSLRAVTATINKNQIYQEILGFGGAFTDATGININSLPLQLQQECIRGYFSEEGLNYNLGRVPIAGTDFSTHSYSYCDVPGDFNLDHFNLAPEDIQYKIPYLKQAMNVSNQPLLFIASSWSAPYWMKTNNMTTQGGFLIGDPGGPYYKTWANYYVKFFEEYQAHNISFWGLTAQNEPTDGFYGKLENLPSLGFSPGMQRDFIRLDLGPAMKNAGFGADKLKLMILDDNRLFLPLWATIVLGNADAAQYVSGIGFHWYLNAYAPPQLLDDTKLLFPNMFLLATEASTYGKNTSVDLGNWENAEKYGYDIIIDLLHSTAGWVDWNLALDEQGGPSFISGFLSSPVIINATGKEFYRQPMYYALGHFSKFLPRGTRRIGLQSGLFTPIELAAFKRPDGAYVIIALNRNSADVMLTISDPDIGEFSHTVTAHSIQSYIWTSS